MSPRTQISIFFCAGIAAQIAAAVVKDPAISQSLAGVGGLLLGWAGFRRPGDGK